MGYAKNKIRDTRHEIRDNYAKKIVFRISYFVFFIALAMMTSCTKDPVGSDGGGVVIGVPEGAEVRSGEILVKFRPEVSDMLDAAGIKTRAAGGNGAVMTRSGVPTVDEVLEIVGGYRLERVFPVDVRHEERTRNAGLHLWYSVFFEEGIDPNTVAEKFASLGEVSKVQLNRELKRNFTNEATPWSQTEPRKKLLTRAVVGPWNDPRLPEQWHYINDGDAAALGFATSPTTTMVAGADVNMEDAWAKFDTKGWAPGDPSIVVAVMDEGVYWGHEDLAANMWVNEGEILRSDVDNDGNGYAGDVYGYNFCDKTGLVTADALDDTGHGTHVAGTIAAVNNNGKGVSGIAGGDGTTGSGVKIMSIQIFSGNRGVTLPNEVRGVKYAADNGAVILQCSWGYMSALANGIDYGWSNELYEDKDYVSRYGVEKEAFDYFIYNAGSPSGVIDGGVVVFASGNEYAAMSSYPGAYKDYISVSSIAGDFSPAPYTNYGPGCDISAPGGDGDYHQTKKGQILSTLPPQHSDYGYMEGTSMACPHVSGVAALGLAYAAKSHKHFNSRDYRRLVLQAVQDLDSKYTGYKTYYDNFSMVGDVHMTKMSLSHYKGKMGGAVDAGKLIDLIDGVETRIALPNVLVATGASQTIDIMRAFDDGETATFTASVADSSIATVTVNGKNIVVKGIKAGNTAFTITPSTGAPQTAIITVRKNVTEGGGWLR